MNIRKSLVWGFAVALATSILLCACGEQSTFDGSKTGDADHFDIEFDVLNTSYSHEMEMNAGDSIDVSAEKTSGTISLTIQKGDADPVYRGNDMETSSFQVGIKDAGKYTMTVSGEKAKGHVVLTRVPGAVENTDAVTAEDAQAADDSSAVEGDASTDETASDTDTSTDDEKEADSAADHSLELYNEIIRKIVAGEEYIHDSGEVYDFSNASAPGYALYDIDGDGNNELFVTGTRDSEWLAYAIYSIKGDTVTEAETMNGYIPDKDLWISGFDFITDAYKFDKENGFTRFFEIEYPFEDEENPKVTYEGEEQKEITFAEVDELLKGEIRIPSGLEWIPLTTDTDLLTDASDKTAASDTAASVSGDLSIESVTWNNGEDEYQYASGIETEFTFHMSDGSEQVLSAYYDPMITGLEMIDIDNDGEDEYVLKASFGNTAGEFEYIYAFKLIGGQVTRLYPTKDIPELAASTPYDDLTQGDLTNTTIVTVEKDGKSLNALEVSMVEKDGGEVKETFHETIIYNEDHWEVLK